jgi:hypothetical protein
MVEINVKIPDALTAKPQPHEVEITWIVARHFKTTVEFLQPIDGYMVKTPDFVMNGKLFEIKSPKGNSKKHTIKDQFNRAKGKKRHMIIDARRTNLDDDFIMGRIAFELKTHRSVRSLLFITKAEQVVVMK